MSKSKMVILWSETAYKKGVCKTCGTKVKGDDGMPTSETLTMGTSRGTLLLCPKCLDNVGIYTETAKEDDEIYKMAKERGWKQ